MKLTDVRSTALGLSVAALLAGSAAVAQAQETFITIGTGGQTGVYYQVGGAVCRLVNRNTAEHHIKCTHTTGGSVDNINGIRNGDLNFGVAQSDWQYHAYNGTSTETFPQGAFKELREIGRAKVRTQVTNATYVCRLP